MDSGAFSLDGEVDLFQLLMSLHDAGSDLNPINGPHPDVKRALLYLQAKAPEQASTLLYWLHRASVALDKAAQVANRALVLAAGRRNLQSAGVRCPRPRKSAHRSQCGP